MQRKYPTIDYCELNEEQVNQIERESNDTVAQGQGTTWFLDTQSGKLYQVENDCHLLEVHARQFPSDIKVVGC